LSAVSRFRQDGSALDSEDAPVNQCFGDLAVRRLDDPAERRSGDLHPLCSLSLVEPFEIRETDRFEFVQSHHDRGEFACRNPGRLEYRRYWFSLDSTTTGRSSHDSTSPAIMNICQ
jgi:hypothetical protein